MTMYTKYLYIRIFLYTMLDSMSDCYRSIFIEIHRIWVEQICIYICFIYFPSIEYWNWSVKIVYRFSQRGDTFNELYYENGGFYSTYILIILINYRVVFFLIWYCMLRQKLCLKYTFQEPIPFEICEDSWELFVFRPLTFSMLQLSILSLFWLNEEKLNWEAPP